MPRTFAKPSLMTWQGIGNSNPLPITDHNRSELGIDVERIETSHRMANGTLRKYVVADKRSFDVSWTELPNTSDHTVDGFMGADGIINFYNDNAGAFTLTLRYGDGTSESYSVVFTDISASLTKRGLFDFWEVSVSMEEV